MRVASEVLVKDLIEKTMSNISKVEKFKLLSEEELNWRSEENSWSVLECLEHLNLYGDFYIPEISSRIDQSVTSPKINFTSGFFGNYFANSMLPKNKLNKMKTFKDKNPIGSKLEKGTIDRFISQQQEMLDLLERSRKIDLNKTKTAISISKLIKLKLGDTFRVVIYHNERHLAQAAVVLDEQNL